MKSFSFFFPCKCEYDRYISLSWNGRKVYFKSSILIRVLWYQMEVLEPDKAKENCVATNKTAKCTFHWAGSTKPELISLLHDSRISLACWASIRSQPTKAETKIQNQWATVLQNGRLSTYPSSWKSHRDIVTLCKTEKFFSCTAKSLPIERWLHF